MIARPSARSALALAVTWWRLPRAAVAARLFDVLPGSLLLVLVASACVGAAMADQAARQALRLLGDQSFIGPEYLLLGVEEFGPLIVAIALALRVGAGFAAEIATEQSEETLDALTLFGREPTRTRLAPMALALVVGSVCLSLIGLVGWELAGMAALALRSNVNPITFFHPEAITRGGVLLLLCKSALCGVLIFVAAARAGLAADAGADAIGRATTRAVVSAVVACMLAGFLLDVVWFYGRSA